MPYAAAELLRREDRRLLMGGARFVDDIHLDHLVHGVFIRSPMAHAEIVRIDASRALAAGAMLVLTAEDLPFLDCAYETRYWHKSIRGGMPTPLASGRVRFVGEAVAFLVAPDRYAAEDLAALVEVEYRGLPSVSTVSAAQRPEAPRLHASWIGNVAATFSHVQGDMPDAMVASPRRLVKRFRFGRQVPLPLETRGCVAAFDDDRKMLTAWISTQAHYNVRLNLAKMLELPLYNIRVVAEDVGGGFGGKSRTYAEEIIVCHASRVLGHPVKWIEDRLEHMQATTHSRAIETEIELGYDENGTIRALRERIVVDIGAYVFTSGIITAEVAAAHLSGPYRIPHLSFEAVCIGTNKTPVATYRGAGQPEAAFPLECMLDLMAKDLGLTGADVRRRNFVTPEELPYRVGTPKGWATLSFESGDFPGAFEQALRNSGYDEAVEHLPNGECRAWGLACSIESSGFVNYESAHVLIDPAGMVTVRSGMTSQGQGQITVYAQICAERLGVAPDRVTVRLGDTDLVPFGQGAFATRGVVVGANAVAGATDRLRAKVLQHAGTLLQKPCDILSIADGVIQVDGVASDLTIAAIAKAVAPGGPLFSGEVALDAQFIHDIKGKLTLGFGVQVARVSLDIKTGFFKVLDLYVLHDAGNILNRPLMDGQLLGGAADGIGGAMLSEVLYGDDGQLLTGTLADYLVLTATDGPRMRLDHFRTVPLTNPLGVRGVGEGGTIGSAPAITNALCRIVAPHRVGGEDSLFNLPLRPESVLGAWSAAQA